VGFIFGMSWLVSQVARPMVELPTPFTTHARHLPGQASGSLGARASIGHDERAIAPRVVGRFERSSAVDVARREDQPEGEALLVATASPPTNELPEPVLPPLYKPEASLVAVAVEREEELASLPGPARPLVAVTTIPEAIVANVPVSGARLLAALRPSPESVADAEPTADAERATPAVKRYQVEPGDSLIKIVRREWDRDDEEALRVLLAANPDVAQRQDRIYPGEVLIIPDPEATWSAAALVHAGPSRANKANGIRWYTIRERDSLASIARRHLNDPERWREIAELNRLHNAHKILPGMRIKLPVPRADT
jgi:nucleoid-associated protein YgaU